MQQGHWSLDAARRLHAAGLTPRGFDPAIEPKTVRELLEAFEHGADRSALAAAFRARFEEEFQGVVAEPDPRANDVQGLLRLEAGIRSQSGTVLLGWGFHDAWSGPLPGPDRGVGVAGGAVLGRAGPVAATLRVRLDDDGPELGDSRIGTELGAVSLWAGVGALAFRTTPYGGAVLSGSDVRPGLGAHTRSSIEVPVVGPIRFSTAFTRLAHNHPYAHPWLWSARLQLSPHARLDLGLNRGAMMGGEGNHDFSLRRVAYVLIGKHNDRFDNQVVSVSARYRPPVGFPLSLQLEWGIEDSAGAWKDVPGLIAAADLAAVPGLPWLALGASGAWFDAVCCGNSPWYHNFVFLGGWADSGRLLGHPLGGHGAEARLYGRADLLDARLQVRTSAFGRDRGRENLFAPDREGRSVGFTLGFLALAHATWQIELNGELETATGSGDWSETRLELLSRATF